MMTALTIAEQITWLQANTVLNQSASLAIQTALGCNTLWLYSTKIPFPVACLTEAEQLVYQQWSHANRQRSWLLGRTLLKFIAVNHPTVSPPVAENSVLETALSVWQFPHTHVSVSHTGTTAYLLINTNVRTTTVGVGLDVECLARKPLSRKALRYLLSPVEYQSYQQLLEEAPQTRWDLQYWTLKEALYKATPLPYQTELFLANWDIQTMQTAQVSVEGQSFIGQVGTLFLGTDMASVALVYKGH